jgi:hypothetical protein
MVHKTTKLGIWLERHNLDLVWLCDNTNLSESRLLPVLCDSSYKPDGTTMRIILSHLKEVAPDSKLSDFWDV